MDLKRLIKRKPLFSYITYVALFALCIVLDQLTKWLAVRYLAPVDTVPIIDGVIHFTYVENPGAAFGMLKNAPWVFNTVSVITILFILVYLFLGHSESKLYSVALVFISAGGVGNMIDRVSLKYVVDFIDFRLIDFAVFNVADSFVCVGAGLMILAMLLDIIAESKKNKVGE